MDVSVSKKKRRVNDQTSLVKLPAAVGTSLLSPVFMLLMNSMDVLPADSSALVNRKSFLPPRTVSGIGGGPFTLLLWLEERQDQQIEPKSDEGQQQKKWKEEETH